MKRIAPLRSGTAALLAVALTSTPAYAVDFFWSATAQTFGWFDRETPNGPPGFSPWTLGGGGISGEAPDDAMDRAFLSTSARTTTLGTSVTVQQVTVNGGNAFLQMNGGVLTTVDGFVINAGNSGLSFTGGTVNNSTGGISSVGVIRGLSGVGNLTGDVNTAGQVIVGNAATLNFGGTNAAFSQTAGSLDVVAGGTANFNAAGYTLDITGGDVNVDGTLSLSNGASFTLNGGNVNAPGTFRVNSGGTFNHVSGAITGEVVLVNNGSALNLMTDLDAPAASVGAPVFRINGNGSVTGDIHQAVDLIVENTSGSVIVGATMLENRGDIVLASGNAGGFSELRFQSGGGLDNNGGTVRAMFSPGATTDRRLTSLSSAGLLTNRNAGQVVVDPGIELLLTMDVDNTADVTIGTGAAVTVGSGVDFNMAAGTLTNNGTLRFNGTSGTALFRYIGGAIVGNAIQFNFGTLELVGGTGAGTFHFLGSTINQISGNVGAGQTIIVDADTAATTLSRGTAFSGDNSFANAGTIRLTGADNNDAATFFLAGNQSTLTNNGLIHAQGVVGSSNSRVFTGSSGAQVVNTGDITIDPDTTLAIGMPVTNTGNVTIGANATLDMDTPNAASSFTHNAGTVVNNGAFVLGSGDGFTFNGGTISGNAIQMTDGVLTLAPATGPASFVMQRGQLVGNINAGQTVELQNNLTSNAITDTPGDMTNAGTLIHGGNGGGGGANIFRLGGLFQNLTLTNTGTYIARNDNASQLGGFRTINGTLENDGSATVEPHATYRALDTINRGNFTIANDAAVSLTGGDMFIQQAGTLTNHGAFNLGNAIFHYTGGDVAGNTLNVNGQIYFGPGLTGGGDFEMTSNGGFSGELPAAATIRFVGPNTNSWVVGVTTLPADTTTRGTIILDNANGGFVNLRALGTHTIETTGTLEGDGRISFQTGPALFLNKGTVTPGGIAGDETGLIRVSGAFTQEATGTLVIQLGGTADADYDRLTATSAVTLAGALDLSLVPGYTPTLGESYTILTGIGVTGVFGSPMVQNLAPGLAGEVSYTANSVVVSIIAAVLPGDTDGDGDIDDTDLGTAFSNYTGPLAVNTGGKTPAQGDVDGDGDVDDSDLGTIFSGYTGPLSPTNVPEPASLALLSVAGLVLSRRRR
ncbi:MAG: PEP-CTERM sorting domain-containing protein [Phycisphaeraceae bacterium]